MKRRNFLKALPAAALALAGCGQAETAPANTASLVFDHSYPLDYAAQFSADCYEGGYVLVNIPDSGRFLVIPEDAAEVDDLPADVVPLRQPLDNIYLVSTSVMDLFVNLDALDCIALSGTKAEGWYVEEAKQAMQEGRIAYAGKYRDLNIAPWRSGIIHLSEINKIPLEKFSDIYIFGLSKKIENENRKQIMNFLYQIEYLNKAPTLIMEVYNKYCENNQRVMDEWNTYYMQLLDLFGSTKTINPQTIEGSVFLEIYKLFIPLINTSNGEYAGTDKWKNEFVIPAINILTRKECSDFSILAQIMILVRNLNIVIIKHDKLNDYSRVFDSYVENLKKAQLIINNSMSYFDGKEIRHFCI